MTDSRKGSSADNRNDGQAAGTGQMLRSSMLIGGFARHGGLEELNTSLHAEHQWTGRARLMTDSRKGSSADNRNDGQAAGTGQMLRRLLRSMLIGGSARHGGLEELNTSLHAEHQWAVCTYRLQQQCVPQQQVMCTLPLRTTVDRWCGERGGTAMKLTELDACPVLFGGQGMGTGWVDVHRP
jgi:hypothetical protein